MIDIKNIVLGFAIFLLTMFVGIYGMSTLFGDSPEYQDYCSEFKTAQVIESAEQCEAIGGQWNDDAYPRPVRIGDGESVDVYGYCDRDYTCRMELEADQEKYHKKVFLVALPLGIIILAIGALVFGLESVGGGLMLGGVGIIIYGVGGFWRFTEDWMKFEMSLVGLVAVIWLTYYWNKRFHDGKRRK